MGFQLLIKAITGIKNVAGIELVMVFAVAALDLTVVARGIRTNEPLPQFGKTEQWVALPHILDELKLIGSMLVRVVTRAFGTFHE